MRPTVRLPFVQPAPKLTEELPALQVITPSGTVRQSSQSTLWAALAVVAVAVGLLAFVSWQSSTETAAENRISASSRNAQSTDLAEAQARIAQLQTQLAGLATGQDDLQSANRQLLAQLRALQDNAGVPQQRIVIAPPSPRPTATAPPRVVPIPVPSLPQWTHSPGPSPTPGSGLGTCTLPADGCVSPTPLASPTPGPSAS